MRDGATESGNRMANLEVLKASGWISPRTSLRGKPNSGGVRREASFLLDTSTSSKNSRYKKQEVSVYFLQFKLLLANPSNSSFHDAPNSFSCSPLCHISGRWTQCHRQTPIWSVRCQSGQQYPHARAPRFRRSIRYSRHCESDTGSFLH
jgi:hypothetical protein